MPTGSQTLRFLLAVAAFAVSAQWQFAMPPSHIRFAPVRCRGVRRMRPNEKSAACEQAPSGWFFVCPRMAHCFAHFVHMWQRFCKAGIKDCIHFVLRNKYCLCILAFVRRGKPGLRNDVNRRVAGCNVSRAHSISKRVLNFFWPNISYCEVKAGQNSCR